jgi:hypothetical protein
MLCHLPILIDFQLSVFQDIYDDYFAETIVQKQNVTQLASHRKLPPSTNFSNLRQHIMANFTVNLKLLPGIM